MQPVLRTIVRPFRPAYLCTKWTGTNLTLLLKPKTVQQSQRLICTSSHICKYSNQPTTKSFPFFRGYRYFCYDASKDPEMKDLLKTMAADFDSEMKQYSEADKSDAEHTEVMSDSTDSSDSDTSSDEEVKFLDICYMLHGFPEKGKDEEVLINILRLHVFQLEAYEEYEVIDELEDERPYSVYEDQVQHINMADSKPLPIPLTSRYLVTRVMSHCD